MKVKIVKGGSYPMSEAKEVESIAIFASTPAQVHFYRNIIKSLEAKGIDTYILARNYGETISLLDEFGFDYYIFSNPPKGFKKILTLPKDVLRSYNYLKNKEISIITGFEIYGAYTSALMKLPYIQFYDSEPSVHKLLRLEYKAMMPFVSVILTPSSFRASLGKKHLKVASYKELAYLHPNYYKPKEDIFDLLGIHRGDDYVVLRFNAFDAAHDEGVRGFTHRDMVELVRSLEREIYVFISSERSIPAEIRQKILGIPKSRIHDVLYYAKLLITDTQTMATEAAILGTPVIRYNSFVGSNDMGNFIELERRYGMMFNLRDPTKVIEKAKELIKTNNIKEEWQRKKERLLREKIDLTAFMVWFLRNYPHSLAEFLGNPEIQYNFK